MINFCLLYLVVGWADAAAKVTSIIPRVAGQGGATRVTIFGEGFLESEPDYRNGGNPKEIKVFLINSRREYVCDVGKDGSTNEAIVCYTRPMPYGNYYVKLVSGNEVIFLGNCGNRPRAYHCTLFIRWWRTPDIRSVYKWEKDLERPESRSYFPGELLQLYGRLFTDAFGSNNQSSSNSIEASFRRVYVGGHSCELLDENTMQPYYIKLESSNHGKVSCKTKGTFTGYSNVSYIVTGVYGRSVPIHNLFQVSGDDVVHMVRSYAVVTGISPTTGSLQGGTLVTVSGKNFDKNIAVTIGGVNCEIIENTVTLNSLQCTTGKVPDIKSDVYSGSRGIFLEWWNETRLPPEDITALNGSETDYRGKHVIQQTGYTWNFDQNFVAKFSGIFVAPKTDNYKFYLRSDDASEMKMNCFKKNYTFLLHSHRYSSHYWRFNGQISDWYFLEKGDLCEITSAVVDYGGQGNLYIAVLRQKTSLTNSQASQAINEIQKIDFVATKNAEHQKLVFSDWIPGSGITEKQVVSIACASCQGVEFRLKYCGLTTDFLSYQTPASNVERALNEILPACGGERVEVRQFSTNEGLQYEVTFSNKPGDKPLIQGYIRSINTGVVINVSEQVTGQPEFSSFSLNAFGRNTVSIPSNAAEDIVEAALKEVTSSYCTKTILPSHRNSDVITINDYEENDFSGKVGGDIVQEIVAFCGFSSLKNPSHIFKVDATAHVGHQTHQPFSAQFYRTICFAHFGLFQSIIGIEGKFKWISGGEEKSEDIQRKFSVDLHMNKDWSYSCVDLIQVIQSHYHTLTEASIDAIYLYKSENDFFVDAVYIGREKLLPTDLDFHEKRKAGGNASGKPISTIVVKKNGTKPHYDIVIETVDCGHQIPLLRVEECGPQTISGNVTIQSCKTNQNTVKVQRLLEATPPMSGSFNLLYTNNGTVKHLHDIPVNSSSLELQKLLESIPGFGTANVKISGYCHSIDYEIEWTSNGGSKELLKVNATNVQGAPGLQVLVKVIRHGGIFHDPIPGEMLRLPFKEPQTEVLVNGIPSLCIGSCTFHWQNNVTPVVTHFDPVFGKVNTTVVISGHLFGSFEITNATVFIGETPCFILYHNVTSIHCKILDGPTGTYNISVIISKYGKAKPAQNLSLKFSIIAGLTKILPSLGFTTGGNKLTLFGHGFSNKTTVWVGQKLCMSVQHDITSPFTKLTCVIPPGNNGVVDVNLNDGNTTVDTLFKAYTYSNDSLPVVVSIQPNQTSLIGGGVINISGENLCKNGSTVTVLLLDKTCKVTSCMEKLIKCILPSLPPGTHSVNVHVENHGIADMLEYNVGGIEYVLLVDDYTPKHGSLFGSTTMTISGKGFVKNESMKVTIGKRPCVIMDVKWENIQCQTTSFTKTLIISNKGYSTVYGEGYAWQPYVLLAQVGDTVLWKWNIPTSLDSNWGVRVFSTSSPTAYEYDGTGFMSSSTSTVTGQFAHRFIEAGTYYYSSGYVDGDNTGMFVMTGVVNVRENIYEPLQLGVELSGYAGMFTGIRNSQKKRRSATCNTISILDNCYDENSYNATGFYVGSKCYSPTVTSVHPTYGSQNTVITILGSGFALEECANSVKIGEYSCLIIFSNFSLIQCLPKPNNTTKVGIPHNVEVIVHNIGKALSNLDVRFVLIPNVENIHPTIGSIKGGTQITISGFGLSDTVSVGIGSVKCAVNHVKLSLVKCTTTQFPQEMSSNVTLTLSSSIVPVCTGSCTFTASHNATPVVEEIVPNPIRTDNTTMVLKGFGFGDSIENLSVKLGAENCWVKFANDTTILCDIGSLPAGQHEVNVISWHKGYCKFVPENKKYIKSFASYAMRPLVGSVAGGTQIVFSGHGFLVDGFKVLFDGNPCTFQSAFSNTMFVCTTPKQDSPRSSTVSFLPTNLYADTSFLYDAAQTPTVVSIFPTTGSVNDLLTIQGHRLNGSKTIVSIGKAECQILNASDTQIQCLAGAHRGGVYELKVLISNLGYALSDVVFNYALNVTSFTPVRGGYGGNIVLHLTGINFDSSMTIQVCDNFCITNETNNATSVLCVLDPEPLVKLTNQSAQQIYSGNIDGSYLSVSATAINPLGHVFSNEAMQLEISSVAKITDNALSHPVNYTLIYSKFTQGQLVTAWRPFPKHGFVCLGDIVTVDYEPNLEDIICIHKGLTIASNASSVIWKSANEKTLIWGIQGSPFSIFTNQNFPLQDVTVYSLKDKSEMDYTVDKLCPVKVQIGSTIAFALTPFLYTSASTPGVESILPVRGGSGGGTLVTVYGKGFSAMTADVKVFLGGISCEVKNASLTQVDCITGKSYESAITLVQVFVSGKGQALNENVYFEYVDLWSSRFTWGGLDPPTTGDLVVISRGQTLVVDISTPVLKFLLIDGGKLVFDDKDIELQAEYILITNGGLLEIGTDTNPFKHKAVITLHGHLRAREIPIYGTKVIGVRNGSLELHGNHVNPVWTYLAETAKMGDTTIHVQVPVSWHVGEKIVIASTGNRHSQRETEVRTIISIGDDRTDISIDRPLEYEHISITEILPDGTRIETKAEVAVLTRNVVVRGSKHVEWNDDIPACAPGFNTGEFATQTCFQGRFGEEEGSDEFGATIMIHSRNKDMNIANAHIENVELTHVGQAFRLGRYPIHFHIIGDNNFNSYVRGCSIHKTFNRAVTIHHTHHVLVENNVVYDVKGGAIFIEDGIEHGNVIQYNLVLFCRQSTSLQNDDITPAAFWVTNPNNTIRHNSAAGGTHFGFWYRMHQHPDGPSFDRNICQQKHQIGEFRNNTVHSQGWFGLWIFRTYTPKHGQGCSSLEPYETKFHSLKTWNCEKGSELVNGGAIQFHNFVMINNEVAGIEAKQIIDGHVLWGQAGVFNSTIVSHSKVSRPGECTRQGVVMPLSEAWMLHNVTFINFDKTGTAAIHGTVITGTCGDLCGGFPHRVENLKFVNSTQKVKFKWEHEMVLYDMDGSLTGTDSKKVVVAHNPSLPPSCIITAEFSVGVAGSTCPGSIKFHRVAWNNVLPSSLEAKDVSLVSPHGATRVKFRKKRMTHKPGWMATIINGERYYWTFLDAEQITNISYSAGFWDFSDTDCVIISHKLTQKPDNTQIYPGVQRNESVYMVSCDKSANGEFYFDPNNVELSYIVSGKEITERKKRGADANAVTRNVKFQAYRCIYKDCRVPANLESKPLARERPTDAKMWSDVSSWKDANEGWGGYGGPGLYSLPKNNTNVKIHPGVWMVGDIQFPKFKELWIEGVLELDGHVQEDGSFKNFVLEATYIIITGRLIVGWEDSPFQGNVIIRLTGNIHSKEYLPSPQITLGAKAIGVFGGLDLHGVRKEIVWQKLLNTVNVGDSFVTLEAPTEWNIGDEIVVTTTSFDPWETETFKITGVEKMGQILTLNRSAVFKHLAHTLDYMDYSGAPDSYSLRGEVGLLSRNIKIIGSDSEDLYSQSFGGRVLIGSFVNKTGSEFRGFARIEDVELYHTGQEGFVDSYDPRYSIAFLRTGTVSEFRPSYVRRCSFHHGFNTAIGIFGARGIVIDKNVIHHTVGPSIRVEGTDNKVSNNLVAICRTRSVYQNRFEQDIVLWKAAIEINKGQSIVLSGNVVAGSERAGYRLNGLECFSSTIPQHNEARAVLDGIFMNKFDGFPTCTKLANFTIHKAYDFAIYYQGDGSLQIQNVLITDSILGVSALIKGPPALSHAFNNKEVSITHSTFSAVTEPGDCSTLSLQTDYVKNNHFARSPNLQTRTGFKDSRVAIMWPSFLSRQNGAPKKPFAAAMSYPALGGKTNISNVTFINYDDKECAMTRHSVIMTNPQNEDYLHPIYTSALNFVNSSLNNFIFFHWPSISKINPSDCVDLECDGMKTGIITDIDGTVLGMPGTIIPQAEYEWNGDTRRGLGDYRIPKTLLTKLDGSRILLETIAPNKGILRANTSTAKCYVNNMWRGHQCHGYHHELLVIESLDLDTETRRLSPVALLSEQYIDLLNGPQDHGWCDGYTCQQRISTFWAVVALNKTYDLHFSGTPPKNIRLRLPMAPSLSIVLKIFYTTPRRLDVYLSNQYIPAQNSYINERGQYVLRKPSPSFIPTIVAKNGANYFDREAQTLYVTVRGGAAVDVFTADVLFISFEVPPISPDDFFDGGNLVDNLASFLGIDSSQIRIVNIVRASQRRRKKRNVATSSINLEIGDEPQQNKSEPQPTVPFTTAAPYNNVSITTDETPVEVIVEGTKRFEALSTITKRIVNALQDGSISKKLNISVLSLDVTPPLPPPGGMLWRELTKNTTTEMAISYVLPDKLQITIHPEVKYAGQPFTLQPEVEIVDKEGKIVQNLGYTDPWFISVRVVNKLKQSYLTGQLRVPLVEGRAAFKDLGFKESGSYQLQFWVSYPANNEKFTETSTVLLVADESQPPLQDVQTRIIIIVISSALGGILIIVLIAFLAKSLIQRKKSAKVSISNNITKKNTAKYTSTAENEYVTKSGGFFTGCAM